MPLEKKRSLLSDGISPGAATASEKGKRLELSIDSFDCPICSLAMVGRIFQCARGHEICETCLERLQKDSRPCPACTKPYPGEPLRCLAMERLAEQCIFPCRWGCGERDNPSKLQKHFKVCKMAPVTCIFSECPHQCPAADMPAHLVGNHRGQIQTGTTTRYISAGGRASWWENGTYKPSLVERGAGWLFLEDVRIKDRVFYAKVRHFDKQLKFEITFSDNQHRALTFTGLTAGLNEQVEEDHIILYEKVGTNLLVPKQQQDGFMMLCHMEASLPQVKTSGDDVD